MFLNGFFFTAVNAAFIAVCCFQTEQQSKFTSGTHSFDMQPHERTREMRLSHGCHSRTQSNLDYWSWTGYFSNWIMDMQITFWQVHRQWWIQGRGLGGPGPPIFRNKLRAKVIFGGTAPDGSGTGRNVHIYAAVWIFLGYYHFKLK